ncbi:hypothetical protein RBE51_20665 [Pseudomonas taiwanensis]|uniref:hypothetical protein n=1 Tax=Pseudomonas taiwanensis TaxID=470150 RepID=UPI0028DEA733|nr:hypothetical protein [Pseudomonas taiwanensis]MDT8925209.1 hypothetical protein [Pseudomonas taiwanensis]
MTHFQFFHQFFVSRVAQSLGIEVSLEDSLKLSLPCPTVEKRNTDGTLKKAASIADLRMGAKDVFFVCTEEMAIMVSPFLVPKSSTLDVRDTLKVGANKQIAQILLDLPEGAFMTGVISKANAEKALRISPHTRLGYFCQMGAGFAFDLERVKQARQEAGGLDWKEVSICLYRKEEFQFDAEKREYSAKELDKAFSKNSELEAFVMNTDVKPNSGEFELLKWLNFPDKV